MFHVDTSGRVTRITHTDAQGQRYTFCVKGRIDEGTLHALTTTHALMRSVNATFAMQG